MEKKHIKLGTVRKQKAGGPVESLVQACLFGVSSLSRVSARSVPGMTDNEALEGVAQVPVNPAMRYPLGLHTNAVPEFCVCLSGSAGMEIQDRRFALEPGDMCLLPAGVTHSEGYLSAKRDYQLLWSSFSADGVSVNCVERNANGWHFPFRGGPKGQVSPAVMEQLKEIKPGDPASFERFRAVWLSALSAFVLASAMPTKDRAEQDPVQQMMLEVKYHIDHHLSARLSLAYLARYSGFTGTHLNRLFRKQFGLSVHGYVIHARLSRAEGLLKQPGASVQDVARQVGYEDPLYFSKAYRARFGRPPSLGMGGETGE